MSQFSQSVNGAGGGSDNSSTALGGGMSSPYFPPNLFGINDSESQVPIRTSPIVDPNNSVGTPIPGGGQRTVNPKQPFNTDTLGNITQAFSSGNATQIAGYQKQLFAGHFYDKSYYSTNGDNYVPGMADQGSRDAFAKAAKEAAASNGRYTIDDVINMHVQHFQDESKSGKIPKLTNPEDVKAVAKTEGRQILGHPIDDALAGQINTNYENMAQTDYQNAQDSGTGYYRSSPSQAWMDEQLRQLRPAEAASFQSFNNFNSMLSMLNPKGLNSTV